MTDTPPASAEEGRVMSGIRKAVSKILEGRSDANFNFDDLCFVLERAGFARRSGKGQPPNLFPRRRGGNR